MGRHRAARRRRTAGELHVAFGVTVVDAGTDTSRVATRAEPDGRGGCVVRGPKLWTTKALPQEMTLNFIAQKVLGLPRSDQPKSESRPGNGSPRAPAASSDTGPRAKLRRRRLGMRDVIRGGCLAQARPEAEKDLIP